MIWKAAAIRVGKIFITCLCFAKGMVKYGMDGTKKYY